MSKNDLLEAIKALDNRVESLTEDVQTQVSKLGLEVLGKMDNNLPRLFVILPDKWFKEKGAFRNPLSSCYQGCRLKYTTCSLIMSPFMKP